MVLKPPLFSKRRQCFDELLGLRLAGHASPQRDVRRQRADAAALLLDVIVVVVQAAALIPHQLVHGCLAVARRCFPLGRAARVAGEVRGAGKIHLVFVQQGVEVNWQIIQDSGG